MTETVDGFVLVDKPVGLTSQQCVTRVKRALGAAKAGHAGTLDPLATGLLVVGLGRATRLLGYLSGQDKQYAATIRLGQATVSDDAQGEWLGERTDATGLTTAAITAAMAAYAGDITQVPSAVSAIKVGGQRAYALVRAGEEVTLTARAVTVTRFTLQARRDQDGWVDLDVTVDCSSGTYVRALARDLGRDLGVGGHLTALRRTRVGTLSVAGAVTLEEISTAAVRGLGEVAGLVAPRVDVPASAVPAITTGRAIDLDLGHLAALFADGRFLALYRPDPAPPGRARPVAVFADPCVPAHLQQTGCE